MATADTGQNEHIEAIMSIIKEQRQSLYGASPENEGFHAFLDFGAVISDKDCEKVICELKAAKPSQLKYDCATIKLVHDILRDQDSEQSGHDGPRVGDRLSFAGMGFFLDVCHGNMDTSPDRDRDAIKEDIKRALIMTEISLDNRRPLQKTSGEEPIGPVENAILGILSEYMKTFKEEMDIMNIGAKITKMISCADVASAQIFWEQLTQHQRDAVDSLYKDRIEGHPGTSELLKALNQALTRAAENSKSN